MIQMKNDHDSDEKRTGDPLVQLPLSSRLCAVFEPPELITDGRFVPCNDESRLALYSKTNTPKKLDFIFDG